jgi:hypothetical protein
MRLPQGLIVCFLAVLASCGAGPSGPGDTDGVFADPQDQETASLVEPAAIPRSSGDEPAPAAAIVGPAFPGEGTGGPRVGFVSGTRFLVFSREEEPSFLVVDRELGQTFRVLGQPMGQAHPPFDSFQQIGFAIGAQHLDLDAAKEGGRILVRSAGGVQLVDLTDRGRMIAAWRGTPQHASIAPDGQTVAISTQNVVHLVRASDGAVGTYPAALGETGTAVRWGDRTVWWTVDGKLTRVDRETLHAITFAAPGATAANVVTSHEADAVAMVIASSDPGTPARVVVFAGDPHAPIMDLPAPSLESIVVDDAGTLVVWVERADGSADGADRGFLHAIDVAARSHVRFAMKGSGCSIAPERVEMVRAGKIITDASCRIGCPSVRWSSRTIAYDARSGLVLDDTSVKEERSFNEQMGEMQTTAEDTATRLGIPVAEMMHDAAKGTLLLVRPTGLAVTKPSDAREAPIPLDDSADAYLSELAFSPDGSVVAGIVDGRARAWDTETGRSLVR